MLVRLRQPDLELAHLLQQRVDSLVEVVGGLVYADECGMTPVLRFGGGLERISARLREFIGARIRRPTTAFTTTLLDSEFRGSGHRNQWITSVLIAA